MSWIVRYSRGCPYCMFIFSREIFQPGYKYFFKHNFNFSSDFYEMSNISQYDPLFYHPKSNTYIVGTKMDPELADMQLDFMRRLDREIYLLKEDRLPHPEITGITDRAITHTDIFTYETVYEKAHEVQLKRPYDYEAESRVLDRISRLISER